ncbi:MAG TPA: ATP-binding protein [Bacteroidales bacterium]|nr:ATP-binding protein [Bacteroidales bacterium]
MSRYIQNLIGEGEHQQLDFKFEITDARRLARTLVAFANTDGGRILIGVKDNGAIAGVRSDEEFYMLDAAAQMYSRPPVPFTFKEWTINGKTVLEIIIAKSDHKPHLAAHKDDKWMAYIRVADQNLLANRVLMKVWESEKKPRGVYLKFTENEKILLEHLSRNPTITLARFSKLAQIPRSKAENILVKFLLLKTIDIRITEKQTFYSLRT